MEKRSTKLDPELEQFVKTYRKSKVVFKENSQGDEMHIILSGKVKIYKEKAPGQNVLLATLESGDFFGVMALVDRSTRSATAIVDEDDTKLLSMDASDFLHCLRHQPEFGLAIMKRLCQRVRNADKVIARCSKAIDDVANILDKTLV